MWARYQSGSLRSVTKLAYNLHQGRGTNETAEPGTRSDQKSNYKPGSLAKMLNKNIKTTTTTTTTTFRSSRKNNKPSLLEPLLEPDQKLN